MTHKNPSPKPDNRPHNDPIPCVKPSNMILDEIPEVYVDDVETPEDDAEE